MPTGTVKWFNEEKGFGFIVPDDPGNDIFVHISAVKDAGWETLPEGKVLEFELREGRNGRVSAANLQETSAGGGAMAAAPAAPAGKSIIPALVVPDVSMAFTFYRRALGFESGREHEEDGRLVFGEVERDGAKIWFLAEGPEGTPAVPQLSGQIFIEVDDVDAFAEDVPPTAIRRGPEDTSYGMREVTVEDPNGYVLTFFQYI